MGMQTGSFPSLSQYQKLKQKISKKGYESLSKEERTLNRNYNYAWQQVVRQNPWPTDNDPQHDPEMHWQAAEMFRRNYRKLIPDLPEPKIHTDEQIAHVAACVRLAKIYIDYGEKRRRTIRDNLLLPPDRRRPVPPEMPLIVTDHLTGAEIEAEIDALLVAFGLR